MLPNFFKKYIVCVTFKFFLYPSQCLSINFDIHSIILNLVVWSCHYDNKVTRGLEQIRYMVTELNQNTGRGKEEGKRRR